MYSVLTEANFLNGVAKIAKLRNNLAVLAKRKFIQRISCNRINSATLLNVKILN